MNKKFVYCAFAAGLMAGFSSCEKDEPDVTSEYVETLQGMYVVNNGNMSGNIPGSITSYDNATGRATQNVFQTANQQSIGDMPQSAMVYGSKIYITASKSNLLWICDANTMKILGQVNFSGEYSEPRYLTNHDGKVYVSLYSGHVAVVDTVSMTIDRAIKVGPNPEQMAVANGKLYVANSDYGRQNGYVSAIDLSSLTETKLDTSVNPNPSAMSTNGKDVFVLCSGNYYDIASAVYKIENNSLKWVCNATNMDVRDDELYVIDAPYGATEIAYEVYSVEDGKKLRDMVGGADRVDSPSGLAVDPVSGNIVILSYTLSAAGYAQYREPCYARIYENNGTPIAKFDTGVGSTWVTFLHHTEVK